MSCTASVHPHARGEHVDYSSIGNAEPGSSPRPWGTLQAAHGEAEIERFIPTPVGNTARPARSAGPRAVHPHARGEHPLRAAGAVAWAGSSPRPWGTPGRRRRGRRPGRFIPTPVGNTVVSRCPRITHSVHPHARGEHRRRSRPARRHGGSSPRPWGTPGGPDPDRAAWRFIPTPVGNTAAAPRWCRRAPVHPHARGEHYDYTTRYVQDTGSSPRPWGTPPPHSAVVLVVRFIPTPVGNTRAGRQSESSGAVHPHARGEHSAILALPLTWPGSSPRPWGTRQVAALAVPAGRFIPTPVGNTTVRAAVELEFAVHPHARGEHAESGNYATNPTGSSPRPWGTHAAPAAVAHRSRFIPTPVGNTHVAARPFIRPAVHPHARGEHPMVIPANTASLGSSPRPWGTPNLGGDRLVAGRFIPTPVGNTRNGQRSPRL